MKKIVAIVLSLVMVLGLAVTAMAAPAGLELWVATDNEDAPWSKIQTYSTTLDKIVHGDEVTEKSLPYYNTASGKFVDCNPAEATHKFVYGAAVTYVRVLDAVEVAAMTYSAKVAALTVTKDDVCGMVKVAKADVAKTFYGEYDVDGDLVAVYVADKNGAKNVLFNGEVVKANDYTKVEVDHKWAGYDVVNYAYTSVKCANCDKVAKLYANATAAGKDAEYVTDFGWITAADAGYGASAPAASDKVESAQTFDAGIAMYVGMSVMAAAGSAVVLKKKD